jgi:signal transduction histidine kinase
LHRLGWSYRYDNQDSLLHYAKIAKALSDKIDYEKGKASYYLSMGSHFEETGEVKESLDAYLEALKIFEGQPVIDERSLAIAQLYASQSYSRSFDFINAVDYAHRSLKYFERINDERGIAQVLITLGQSYNSSGDILLALDYNKRAVKIYQKLGLNNNAAIVLNNIGLSYKDLKQYDSARLSYQKALSLMKEKDYTRLRSYVFNNIGTIFLEQAILDSALFYYQTSYDLKLSINDLGGQASGLTNLGNVYSLKGENKLAFEYLDKAIALSKKIGQPNTLIDALVGIHQNAYQMKDFRQAYLRLNELKVLSDSINSEEKSRTIAEIETKYETQKKDNEILELANEGQKKELQLAQSRYTQTIFGGIAFGLMITIVVVVDRRKRALRQARIESETKVQSRIAMDLHDGFASDLMKIENELPSTAGQTKNALAQARLALRSFSHQLDANRKAEGTLEDMFIDYLRNWDYNKLIIEVKFKPAPFEVHSKATKMAVYRIAQELISNTVKHSNGNACSFSFEVQGKYLILKYEDKGKNFDLKKLQLGNGFKNIEERVKNSKGKLELNEEAQNFCIKIYFPIKKRQFSFL